MDLSTVKIEEQVEIVILHPETGLPTDMVFTMATTDSKHYNSIIHRLQNQRLYNKRAKPTAEQIDETAMNTIAECTLGWKNVSEDGKDIKCTVENALKLYKKHNWIFEQVNVDMADRKNFLSIVPAS